MRKLTVQHARAAKKQYSINLGSSENTYRIYYVIYVSGKAAWEPLLYQEMRSIFSP